jgi:hypothetical protein
MTILTLLLHKLSVLVSTVVLPFIPGLHGYLVKSLLDAVEPTQPHPLVLDPSEGTTAILVRLCPIRIANVHGFLMARSPRKPRFSSHLLRVQLKAVKPILPLFTQLLLIALC